MKFLARMLLVAALACAVSGCLFKEPVFSEGFAKADASLGGVWVAEGERGDPRKMEFAVMAPLDDTRFVLHHPAGEKGGMYYEARALTIRGRTVLQLRVLATFSDGIPKRDAERYTLLWIEKEDGVQKFRVHTLGGDGVKNKGPADVKKLLEAPDGDWSTLFSEPTTFRRLEDGD